MIAESSIKIMSSFQFFLFNNPTMDRHRSEAPPSSPPLSFYLAALTIASLIFLCIYGSSSTVIYVVIFVTICIAICVVSVFVSRFIHERKLLANVVRFGNVSMASISSSDCAICIENFQNGEECLVFPNCGHLFHLNCINHWIQANPTCPICRHRIPLATTVFTA
ncbi:hypothetical protein S83_042678 [Arachis hypogaea]|nr:RING-H2 finger protein [Arachis hypogaea]